MSNPSKPNLSYERVRFWRYFLFLRDKIYENRYGVLIVLVLAAIVVPIVIARMHTGQKIYNNSVGYEMIAPPKWKVIYPANGYGIVFEKPANRQDPAARGIIRLDIDVGNPWGGDSMNYLKQGILPAIKQKYSADQFHSLHFDEEPYFETRAGVKWAVVKFLIDLDEIQIIHVALRDDLAIIIGFKSVGREQDKDEKLLYKVLDSVKLNIDAEDFFLKNPQAR